MTLTVAVQSADGQARLQGRSRLPNEDRYQTFIEPRSNLIWDIQTAGGGSLILPNWNWNFEWTIELNDGDDYIHTWNDNYNEVVFEPFFPIFRCPRQLCHSSNTHKMWNYQENQKLTEQLIGERDLTKCQHPFGIKRASPGRRINLWAFAFVKFGYLTSSTLSGSTWLVLWSRQLSNGYNFSVSSAEYRRISFEPNT